MCGGIASSSTSWIPLVYAVRILEIRIYFAGGTPTTATDSLLATSAIEWIMPTGDRARHSRVVMGNRVGSLICKPPAKSLASFWLTRLDTAANVFALTCPDGALIDFVLAWRASNGVSISPRTCVGATTNVFSIPYFPEGSAASDLIPVGITAVEIA